MSFATLVRRLVSKKGRIVFREKSPASRYRRVAKWLRCKSCSAELAMPGETLRTNWAVYCACGRMVLPTEIQDCLAPDVELKTGGAL